MLHMRCFGKRKKLVTNKCYKLLDKPKLSNKNLVYFLMLPVWPEKNRQMSIEVAQKWFHKKKDRFWHPYKKLPNNVGKLIVTKGLKKLPKVQ